MHFPPGIQVPYPPQVRWAILPGTLRAHPPCNLNRAGESACSGLPHAPKVRLIGVFKSFEINELSPGN
jgi:hypothetical protein